MSDRYKLASMTPMPTLSDVAAKLAAARGIDPAEVSDEMLVGAYADACRAVGSSRPRKLRTAQTQRPQPTGAI